MKKSSRLNCFFIEIFIDAYSRIFSECFLEYNNHSSTLATTKPKHDKPSPPAALSNKIYYVLNNERTPAAASKPTRDNNRSTGIPRVPVGDTNRVANCKQQSSVTLKKNQLQTSSITANQRRLTTQTSSVKNTSTKTTTTTTTSKPRVTIDRFLSDVYIQISHADSYINH